MFQGCLYCGGDRSEPGHDAHCDGRQGRVEAELPLLASGLTEDTYATSYDAAVAADAATQRALVLAEFRGARRVGRTDDEVQQRLGLSGSSERPRRWELWHLGLITARRDERGQVVKRETRTHRRAVVWIASEFTHGA